MNATKQFVAFCLISASSSGIAAQQTIEYIDCEATLTGFVPEFSWAKSEVVDGLDVVFYQELPLATFTIVSPSDYSGRTVKVLFAPDSAFNDAISDLEEYTGGKYRLELPQLYFDGPDGQIVEASSLRSVSRASDEL